ncbi:MAG TPA: TetR family transcriptional regulator [Nitriliruptorales bacterium]|nr:TetR family transcriptional regulator [Nitriliruptorales bacterium]
MARTGRRPGDSGTREAILLAARQRFADAGYRAASIRSIATRAGVDPALVHHYFGTKRDLFATVLQLPIDPDVIVQAVLAGDAVRVGERVVRSFLTVWDEARARDRMLMLLRSAVTDDHVARMMREFVLDTVFGPIARGCSPDEPELRATLAASQLLGFAMVRFVICMEPLASAPHDRLVAAYAPSIQRYLTGDLTARRGTRAALVARPQANG